MPCYNCRKEDAVDVSIGSTLYSTCRDKRCRSLLHEKLDEEIQERFEVKSNRDRLKRKGLMVEY